MNPESHKPTISVIMAAYNAELYIEQAVTSILNQSYRDLELIIVDDHSSDNTLDIVQKLANLDARIRLYSNATNMAVSRTRNKAIELSRGKYIAIQDADDLSMSDRLKIQMDFLEKNKDYFLVGSGGYLINEKGDVLKKFIPETNFEKIHKILETQNCIYHSTVMFRNNDVVYREKIFYCEDYDLYLNILTNNKKIGCIGKPLIYYRIVASSISHLKAGKQWLFSEQVKKFYFERKKTGHDGYSVFEPNSILSIDSDKITDKGFLLVEMNAYLQVNNVFILRKLAKKYFSVYGYSTKVFMYYIVSLLGSKNLYFIKTVKYWLTLLA